MNTTKTSKDSASKNKATTKKSLSPSEIVTTIEVMPIWSKIALGVLAVGVIILMFLYFSKPDTVVVNDHTAAQKAYENQHQSDSTTIAFKDSVGVAAVKEANYWKGVAQEKQKVIINNLQLYQQNEKKYQTIISNIKPIYNLDSLRAAIKPKY